MAIELRDLRRYVKQCDPQRPLPAGDPLYVPLDEGPAAVRGNLSCVDALYKTIAYDDTESCQLLTGFLGTGKTTELKRLEDKLTHAKDLPTHTIYVDFEEYIDRYAPISISDILRVIAYCMDREATIAEGGDPDKNPGYLKRFYELIQGTSAELKGVTFETYGTQLMLEIKNNPSFRRRAEEALEGRFQKFARDAQDVMAQSVVRLRKAPGSHAQRVVVIADGLEKLTPLREEDRKTMEAGVETVFLAHRDFLRLPCHVIYTFPLWLRFRTAQLGIGFGREPLILPMVKIRELDGTPYEAGIAKLTEMIRLRVENLSVLFGSDPSATLRPLIEASGGYPRDLLRMVRSLLFDAKEFPIRVEDTERVIRELARSYEDTLWGTYLDVLAHVARTHKLPKDDPTKMALFGNLFERWLILAYRNGEEWYDLHPLVRKAPIVQEYLAKTAPETASQ